MYDLAQAQRTRLERELEMARAGHDLQDEYYGDARFAAAISAAPAEAPALLAHLLADLFAFTASESLEPCFERMHGHVAWKGKDYVQQTPRSP